MAKIDITKLEGYKDDMTAEEKLKLYESYEIAEPSYDGYIKKDTFDKTASELANVKKQLKDRMSEDEVKEAERAQKDAEIMEELIEQTQLMQYGVIIVAAFPMLCIYPFIQKYFVKGVMVGAVKG